MDIGTGAAVGKPKPLLLTQGVIMHNEEHPRCPSCRFIEEHNNEQLSTYGMVVIDTPFYMCDQLEVEITDPQYFYCGWYEPRKAKK